MRVILSKASLLLQKAGRVFLAVLLILALLLILRATFRSPLAEAATNTYHPGYCLGGWENPDAAAGKPGKTEPNGRGSAAYLAPDVFAQIFCGYFPVSPREKPPKDATVIFNFSLSGEVPVEQEEQEEQEEEGGGGSEQTPVEEVVQEEDPIEEETAPEEEAEEEVPEESTEDDSAEEVTEPESEEPSSEESSEEESSQEESSSESTSFLDFFLPKAHAEEAEESLLVVSYSFDGVRWYAAGRMTRENANSFSMQVPAEMWSELENLQIMAAPLPVSSERPDIFLESVELKVEADLTIAEMAADGAAAVGGVIGEVLGVVDTLEETALGLLTPTQPVMQPNLPPPPVKKKALLFELAGDAIAAEGAGKAPPEVDISVDGLTLRVDGSCVDSYYVILTYRSIEDFVEKPRSFVSNYADECRGADFHSAMKHLPVGTEPGVYYLVVGTQGDEGSWRPVSSLLPIRISETEVMEEAP